MATSVRQNLVLRAWALRHVPVLAWVQPRIVSLSDDEVVVAIPLGRRQKNHLGSMYFGVLACGADVAGGLLAVKLIHASGEPVNFVFKDFRADFLKRPEATTHFTCRDGEKIAKLVAGALAGSDRVSETVRVTATCPERFGDEAVAVFDLTLSLKRGRKGQAGLLDGILAELKKRLPLW